MVLLFFGVAFNFTTNPLNFLLRFYSSSVENCAIIKVESFFDGKRSIATVPYPAV